jgi:DNA-binding NtrC family response regulator
LTLSAETSLLPQSAGKPWSAPGGAPELLGGSPAITRTRELLRRAATQTGPLLITAEAGVRVEVAAAEVHRLGASASAPLVFVDCAAGDAARFERALFGATQPRATTDLERVSTDSFIASTSGGTLFLQEIGELPGAVQARLVRIVRDGQVHIDDRPEPVSFRLVASAARDIEAEVHERRFRADLYRRLALTRVDMPSLHERTEDVPVLAARVLADICAAEDRPPLTFTHSALAFLGAMTWPGNLTELRDVIERAVRNHGGRGATVQIEHLLPALRLQRSPAPFVPHGSLRDARLRFERDYITAVLQHHRWSMTGAAETLGIQRPNLYRKARQLGIPLVRLPE